MADAGIAAWYWKYEYDFWRPVLGIREAEKGWGPTGKGDGNSSRKKGDPFWLPLGAPNSNPRMPTVPTLGAAGSNGTPNFPAYPSGHATFGSAAFITLAKLLGKQPQDISFKFVSDEFNGTTTDNTGATRPRIEETFTLRKAIDENKKSRIFLGVHWSFDASGGELVGNAIAEKVFNAFKP
jgi:membrane-associated phospholipid phosphatase